jgi:hypothetical protein
VSFGTNEHDKKTEEGLAEKAPEVKPEENEENAVVTTTPKPD